MRAIPLNSLVTVAEVRQSLIERREIALLDVREEEPFAQAHPLFAASLPLSRLEIEAFDRIPRLTAPIVVYDAGEGLAQKAASRLRSLGYQDVALLDGGLEAWARAGAELFRDVNVPSKAFGELVEAVRHTPSLSAEELHDKVMAHDDIVVLDARRFEEYAVMSIPTATSVPGGELVLRVREHAPGPDTLVVVNCAGRTRSILGAQSLINAAIPNPVVALRNGTIGWTLAGFSLDHRQERRHTFAQTPASEDSRRAALALAARAGVGQVDAVTLEAWRNDTTRTLYRFDVRTPEEYVAGHLPGFASAPGGQLVQETDGFAPVRGARIVLTDDEGVRAPMTASWLAQMGWEVFVLPPSPLKRDRGASTQRLPPLPVMETVFATELAQWLKTTPLVIVDFSLSADYGKGHLPGAVFALRSCLEEVARIAQLNARVVFVSRDGVLATFAAADFHADFGIAPWVLAGGTIAWKAAGFALEADSQIFLSPPIDRYKRPYEGTDNPKEAMQAYLDWEYGLVAQLHKDQTHHFRVL